jgi:hypothetical protein
LQRVARGADDGLVAAPEDDRVWGLTAAGPNRIGERIVAGKQRQRGPGQKAGGNEGTVRIDDTDLEAAIEARQRGDPGGAG